MSKPQLPPQPTPDIKIVYDVFLSYSRKNEAKALDIITLLKSRGLNVFWDRDFQATVNWETELVLKIAQSAKVVVLWSPDAATSPAVLAEVKQAALNQSKLVAFTIEPYTIPDPYGAIQSHLITDIEAQSEQILALVGHALKRAHTFAAPAGLQITLPNVLQPSADFFGRDTELTMLVRAWESGDGALPDPKKKTNVVAITAMGGAGKTALIRRFMHELAERGYAGADRVYGWSAYSQGSHENRQASSEPFLTQALSDFGHDLKASPLQGGRRMAERLAELIGAQRTLFILDGLEPLQHPPVVNAGRFKDEGLDALVRALDAKNRGLLVLTSRQAFPELPKKSAPRVVLHNLGPIDQAAGIALLESKGVVGPRDIPRYGVPRAAKEPVRSLADLVAAAAGHALTLHLLGAYIAATFGGDVRQADTVRLTAIVDELAAVDAEEDEAAEAAGADAGRTTGAARAKAMMRHYEERFAELAEAGATGQGRPELALVSILGLFDRPVPGEIVDLLVKAAIPGLTDNLAKLSPHQWRGQRHVALERLADLRLVERVEGRDDGTLDAHPLVREHFGARLAARDEVAFKAAHKLLFEHYRWLGVPEALHHLQRREFDEMLETLQWLPEVLPAERPGEARTAYVERLVVRVRERAVALAEKQPDAELRSVVAPELRHAPIARVRAAYCDRVTAVLRTQVTELFNKTSPAVLAALFPPTLPAMEPLFQAVAHGCKAGEVQATFNDVFYTSGAAGQPI